MVSLFTFMTLMAAIFGIMAGDEKIGACFSRKTARGCRDFIAHVTREQCCEYQGFFVRNPDRGQLFASVLMNAHSLPNCENPCGIDYCQNKQCPEGHRCINRNHDSICTSDCRCTEEQLSSGPVCVSNGPKYRSMCDLHLQSCWTNTNQTITRCKKSGCERRRCGNRACVLSLKGRSKCVHRLSSCDNALPETICGVDKVTYASYCHIRQAGILRQREIQVAYKGPCKDTATCSNVECPKPDMSCVKDHRYSSPVCIKCPRSLDECDSGEYESDELFCLSIQRQSQNTCYKDYLSCQNNEFIEIIHSGMCLQVAKLRRTNSR